MRRQREKGMRSMRRPHAHSPVPATRAETVFGDKIPVNAEDFAIMFFPVLDGIVGDIGVEELDATVAGGCEELVFVDFGPAEVVEGVLGCEPGLLGLWLLIIGG